MPKLFQRSAKKTRPQNSKFLVNRKSDTTTTAARTNVVIGDVRAERALLMQSLNKRSLFPSFQGDV